MLLHCMPCTKETMYCHLYTTSSAICDMSAIGFPGNQHMSLSSSHLPALLPLLCASPVLARWIQKRCLLCIVSCITDCGLRCIASNRVSSCCCRTKNSQWCNCEAGRTWWFRGLEPSSLCDPESGLLTELPKLLVPHTTHLCLHC